MSEAPGTADQVATQADDGLSGALIGAAVASGGADASDSLPGGEAEPEVVDIAADDVEEDLLFTSESD